MGEWVVDWQVDCGIRTLVFGKKGEVGGVLGGEGMLDSRRLEDQTNSGFYNLLEKIMYI